MAQYPQRIPGSSMIDAAEMNNIMRVDGKGVIVKNRFGHILAYIKEDDPEKIEHYANELMALMEAIHAKRKYVPNFELPVPSLPAPSEEGSKVNKKVTK